MMIIIWDSPTAMDVEVAHTTSKAMEIDHCCNTRQVYEPILLAQDKSTCCSR